MRGQGGSGRDRGGGEGGRRDGKERSDSISKPLFKYMVRPTQQYRGTNNGKASHQRANLLTSAADKSLTVPLLHGERRHRVKQGGLAVA